MITIILAIISSSIFDVLIICFLLSSDCDTHDESQHIWCKEQNRVLGISFVSVSGAFAADESRNKRSEFLHTQKK